MTEKFMRSSDLPKGVQSPMGAKDLPKTSSGDKFYMFKLPINRRAAIIYVYIYVYIYIYILMMLSLWFGRKE